MKDEYAKKEQLYASLKAAYTPRFDDLLRHLSLGKPSENTKDIRKIESILRNMDELYNVPGPFGNKK